MPKTLLPPPIEGLPADVAQWLTDLHEIAFGPGAGGNGRLDATNLDLTVVDKDAPMVVGPDGKFTARRQNVGDINAEDGFLRGSNGRVASGPIGAEELTTTEMNASRSLRTNGKGASVFTEDIGSRLLGSANYKVRTDDPEAGKPSEDSSSYVRSDDYLILQHPYTDSAGASRVNYRSIDLLGTGSAGFTTTDGPPPMRGGFSAGSSGGGASITVPESVSFEVANAVDADILQYDEDLGEWVNVSLLEALGPKDNANPFNHDRFEAWEAAHAMGVKANDNPYHHDRYTDAEAIAAAGGASAMDDLSDADTTTSTPTSNQCLKWNGSTWVPGSISDSAEFTFQINTITSTDFTVNGVNFVGATADTWLATSMDLAVAWQNGTVTSGDVAGADTNGTAMGVGFPLALSTFSTPETVVSTGAVVYPPDEWSNGSCWYKFTATVSDGASSPTKIGYAYFRNKKWYGLYDSATPAPSDPQYTGLTGSYVTISYALSEVTLTLSATAQYIHLVYPSRISGTPVFKINGFTTAFTDLGTASLNNQNGATGYSETYQKYRSPIAYDNATSATLTLQVS